MSETAVTSFVLRFIHEQEPDRPALATQWRGIIRHVQSEEQLRFTHVEEALAFIGRFVDITNDITPRT